MRVILLYVPLILLLHAVVIAAAVYSLTVLPIRLFGGWTYAWVVGGTIFVLLMLLVIKFIINALIKRAESHPGEPEEQKKQEEPLAAVKEEARGPSFFDVFWAYVDAVHEKICPMIVFKRTGVRS